MPIFEYVCQECGGRYEKLIRRTEEERALACPSCGSSKGEKILSTFAAHANGRPAEPAAPACGSGMCGMPGRCGLN